jgi:uncharacterized membrane protein (UPF0127 family)
VPRARAVLAGTVIVAALLGLYLLAPPTTLLTPAEHERTAVTLVDSNGTELASVDVRVAATGDQRRVGLSRTDSLEAGAGMLFVHDSVDTRSYVMRNMSFGLDIVFIDSDGTITEIHDAPAPPGGDAPYRGTGQYVLEVPRGWTDAVGVSVGDGVEIPAAYRE